MSNDPSSVKAVGHPKGHDEGGDGACSQVLRVDDQTLTLVSRLIMHKANEVAVVLGRATLFWRKDGFSTVTIRPVSELNGSACFTVVLHDTIKSECALDIENAGIDKAGFVAGKVIIHPGEVAGGLAD